jgi:hypothetical protein
MCKMCCNLGSKTVHAPFHLLPALFLLVSRPAISIHLPPLVLPSLLNNCQIINKLIRLFRGQSSNLPGLSLRPEPEPEPVLVLGPWPWPCLCRIRFPALHCTSSPLLSISSTATHTTPRCRNSEELAAACRVGPSEGGGGLYKGPFSLVGLSHQTTKQHRRSIKQDNPLPPSLDSQKEPS